MPRLLSSALGCCASLALATASLGQQKPVPQKLDAAAFAARVDGHWAWHPLRTAEPPRPGHPVDAFVEARLQAAGLARSAPAAPDVQLRRLWLDLVGLPPPPAAVASFVADPSDAHWEREVDALLASPQFAERQARHWLDLVRYAETLGHEFDFPIPNAWRYRDYVVRAIDADVPFDQFLREHLAGDLLPQPRRAPDGGNESVIATGAWWFGEQVHSPVDVQKYQADRIDNQLDVFGKAMLGMTVACARCHDHKFDAITANDYYALSGYLRSSRYVQAPIQPVDVHGPAYRTALAAQRDVAAAWDVAAPARTESGVVLRGDDVVIADTAGHADAWFRNNDGFGAEPWSGPFCVDPAATVPTLRQLPGPFWHSGAAGVQREGELQSPTFPLAQRYVHVRVAGRHARVRLVVEGFLLVRDPIYGSLHRGIDDPRPHWITFDTAPWAGRPAYVACIDQRTPDFADPQHERGRYPADAWLAVQCVVASPHAEPPATTSAAAPLPGSWITPPPALGNALAALRDAQDALPVSPTVPGLGDGTGNDEGVHLRGNPHTKGAIAHRRFLRALAGESPAATGPGSGRLQLAEAVLAVDNPLPARVFVNRAWHHLFGRGLVRSVDNFGELGDRPSHPELLDWLARDCVQHGWSRKHVLRTLVTSATYRQDSRQRAEAANADGDNVLLHRQNVRRLEAEALRDALLAVAGRLDPTRFGPPIELPLGDQPQQRGRPDRDGPLDGAGRRTIYLAVRRNFRSPLLCAFDQPTPFATVGARNQSNVPAQALALANDAFVHAMAAAFAARLLDDAALPAAQRLAQAYRLAIARPPTADEQAACDAFLAAAADERQGWTDLLHALLNTTEFCFRR